MASIKCPKCETDSLKEFAVQGVRVDRCASCSGTWFDARELSQLLAEDSQHVSSLRRGTARDEAGGKKGMCPRDAVDLLRVFSAIDRSVILDACPECHGIWLDGGEFEKLFAARQH